MRKLVTGLAFVALVAGSSSSVSAKHRKLETSQHRSHHHRYTRLPPHQQPRRANNPDKAIGAAAGEKTVDRKINDICRGC
jgi:hypothetical protein